jgi:hypothetical protein
VDEARLMPVQFSNDFRRKPATPARRGAQILQANVTFCKEGQVKKTGGARTSDDAEKGNRPLADARGSESAANRLQPLTEPRP